MTHEVNPNVDGRVVHLADEADSNKFDPQIVLDKAVELWISQPDAAPVLAEIFSAYIEVLASLLDDYEMLGRSS